MKELVSQGEPWSVDFVDRSFAGSASRKSAISVSDADGSVALGSALGYGNPQILAPANDAAVVFDASLVTLISSTGANTGPLADGTVAGQTKWIYHRADGGSVVITPDHFDHTSITLSGINEWVSLIWSSVTGKWYVYGKHSNTTVNG